MADQDLHSTGRGGSGNIGQGEGQYADAAALKTNLDTSTEKSQDHSTGRGGSGNIVHESKGAQLLAAGDEKDGTAYADFHTGRGGEGNIHRDKFGGHSKPQKEGEGHEHGHGAQLMDKARHAVGLDKK